MGQLGFSVASCGHGSRMTRKAMLDKSGVYSKLSAKAELNLQLRMTLQLHAATCSMAWWKFAIFMYPCMKYKNLQGVIEQCRCEGILTKLRELERKRKPKLIIIEDISELKRHGLGRSDYF